MDDAASEPEGRRAEAGDGAAPRVSHGKGRALVPVPRPAPRADFAAGFVAGLGRSHGVVAAGVAVVMGFGFVAGTAAFANKPQTVVLAQAMPPMAPPVDPTMAALDRVQGEVRALHAGLDALRGDGQRGAAEDRGQADAIRGLKKSVDTLKQDVETVKASSAASAGAVGQLAGQLSAKIDRLDRDPGPKLAEIAARLDKLDREPAADARTAQAAAQLTSQLTSQLAARLDRVERQVASADGTGSIPPQTPAQASTPASAPARAPLPPPRAVQAAPPPSAPVPPAPSPVAAVPPPRPEAAKAEPAKSETAKLESAKPDASKVEAARPARPELLARAEPAPQPRQPEAPARPATVDGWLLRDVYGGVALVEGRAGGLREVAPGEYVPGVGEIRSIERRGRGWVVVTSRGLIQADNRW